MDELKSALKGLDSMPVEELEFVSKKNALIDCALYHKCVEKNDMTAWEKLKTIRKMFK